MKRNINSVLLLVSITTGIFSFAQQSRTLSLNEAVELGLQNSKTLKIDDAKIEQATANYIAAKNKQLPDLSLSASALALANAEVDIKLMQGAAGGSSPKVNQAYYGMANLSLPIYAGGRIKYGIQSAEYLIEANKYASENNKTAIAYTVSQAYNNLYKAQQTIKVLQENLKASQERDKNFLNLENNGVIARNDRLKANLQTSNIELQLMEAQSQFEIANINMDLLLGLSEDTKIEVDPNYATEELEQSTVDYYLQKAFENRTDVKSLDYQKKAAEVAVKAAKAEELPTVAVTAGYVAADIPKVMTLYNAANVGLGVQYNLSHLWKKNSNLMDSQAKIKQLDATNEALSDQIKLEVHRDYQNYILAKRKIELYEKSVEQANENYRITKNKYNNGLETITNLLEADAAQISANVNVLNAKADAALAYRKLLQTSGILITK